ncbi:hypothetical protein Lser_V15G01165 [Lactuca serriola]
MYQNGQGIDLVVLDHIINRLLEFQLARTIQQVQLVEAEIRQLCATAREMFLLQPDILELEAPIKICDCMVFFGSNMTLEHEKQQQPSAITTTTGVLFGSNMTMVVQDPLYPMSKFDNYGLLKSRGTSIPHEDDIPRFDRGTRDHTSLPPPQIIFPNPQVQRLEKFKITQALLASKHKEGKSVCAHVLGMKSHIDRLRMLGSVVCEEMAVDWVLQSLPNSYSEFVREYYMMNRDVTLIDLTYMLISAESEMFWRNGKAELIGESAFKSSMDIDNGYERHAMIEKFDHKRKAMSEVVSCHVPKESICFYCQEKGHWRRSCPIYLRDLRDGRVETIEEKKGSLREEVSRI